MDRRNFPRWELSFVILAVIVLAWWLLGGHGSHGQFRP